MIVSKGVSLERWEKNSNILKDYVTITDMFVNRKNIVYNIIINKRASVTSN